LIFTIISLISREFVEDVRANKREDLRALPHAKRAKIIERGDARALPRAKKSAE
jgi:hypothetical protein